MDVSVILKLTGLGLLVSVACHVLKKSGHDELVAIISAAGIAASMLICLDKLSEAVELIKRLFSL